MPGCAETRRKSNIACISNTALVDQEMILGFKGGELKLFSDENILALHNASLLLLKETGVVMQNVTALEVMADAGADVDRSRQVVKIPEYLVEEALAKAPKTVKLYGHSSESDIVLFKNMVYNGSSNNAVRIILQDGRSRSATFKDLEDFVRLQDALTSVHIMLSPLTDFVDVPKTGVYRRCYEAVLKNSPKHSINQAESAKDVRAELEMAAAVMGWDEIDSFSKYPIFSMICDMAPPLKLGSTTLEVMIECARHGVPIHVETDCAAGATAPITTAGLVIQQNAEILSGITLVQLIRPGCPIIYAHSPFAPDMRTGAALTGAPERSIFSGASVQLAKFYGIPACGVGGASDSKVTNIQAGYEKAISFITLALDGHNIIQGGLGMLESHNAVSMEQSVIDDEIFQNAFRIMQPSEISERTILEGLEVIKAVGPGGSHFMAQKHTLQNLSELHVSELAAHVGNKKTLLEAAHAKVQKLLQEHSIPPLPRDIAQRVEELSRSA